MTDIAVIITMVFGPPLLLWFGAKLADLAGEAEWAEVQREWDAYSPSATGALRREHHREIMDRSSHLL